jgi:hypothetical protein
LGDHVEQYWIAVGHMFEAALQLALHPRGEGVVGSQWGPPPPQAFVDQVS